MRLVDCARASEVTIRGLDIVFGDWVGAEQAHAQWACVKTPHLGTINKDCVLMVSGECCDYRRRLLCCVAGELA